MQVTPLLIEEKWKHNLVETSYLEMQERDDNR